MEEPKLQLLIDEYLPLRDVVFNTLRQGILKESKKEKTILDLCLKGDSMKEIMFKTGYSSRTISYRKKDIYLRICKFL